MTEYGGYRVENDGSFGMKHIKSIGRGALPNELRGSFTSILFAKKAIDIVQAHKGNKNDEVISGI